MKKQSKKSEAPLPMEGPWDKVTYEQTILLAGLKLDIGEDRVYIFDEEDSYDDLWTKLGIDETQARNIAREAYGYNPDGHNDWPRFRDGDYEALTRFLNRLHKGEFTTLRPVIDRPVVIREIVQIKTLRIRALDDHIIIMGEEPEFLPIAFGFTDLGEAFKFAEEAFGYPPKNGPYTHDQEPQWPEYNSGDMEAATRYIKALMTLPVRVALFKGTDGEEGIGGFDVTILPHEVKVVCTPVSFAVVEQIYRTMVELRSPDLKLQDNVQAN